MLGINHRCVQTGVSWILPAGITMSVLSQELQERGPGTLVADDEEEGRLII